MTLALLALHERFFSLKKNAATYRYEPPRLQNEESPKRATIVEAMLSTNLPSNLVGPGSPGNETSSSKEARRPGSGDCLLVLLFQMHQAWCESDLPQHASFSFLNLKGALELRLLDWVSSHECIF